jgi:hypothetical protein
MVQLAVEALQAELLLARAAALAVEPAQVLRLVVVAELAAEVQLTVAVRRMVMALAQVSTGLGCCRSAQLVAVALAQIVAQQDVARHLVPVERRFVELLAVRLGHHQVLRVQYERHLQCQLAT